MKTNKKKTTEYNITNEKLDIENNDEQDDNNLKNRKYTSDKQEQIKDNIKDILALEEENQEILALEEDSYYKDNDSNNEILSLHDDFDVDTNEDHGTLNIQNNYHEEDDTSSTSDFKPMNDADDDLVTLLSMITGLEESTDESNKKDIFALEETEDDWSHEQSKNISDDKTNPYTSSSSKDEDLDDNILNDILSIDSLFDDEPNQTNVDKNPGDLGGVFSDSLSVINLLNDQAENEDFNNEITLLSSQTENRETVKKKKWAKIFGTSKNEVKEMEEDKEKPKKKEKVKKSKKKSKDKLKDKVVAESKDNSNQEEEQDNRKVAKGKKEKKIKDKKYTKAKKEKAKKKNVTKDPNAIVKEVMEEEDKGKISKTGTSLALICCGLIAIFIIIGTNIYTYSLNIKKAESDFERQRYTDAYNDIYGYKVKTRDMELYNKIMTVMYVNKQLNSFYNYSSLNKQPEALDSLLKGLARYEEVNEKAVSLGIKEDMDNIKSQIINELKVKYKIKEKEALAIVYTEDQEEYTQYILNTVAESKN